MAKKKVLQEVTKLLGCQEEEVLGRIAALLQERASAITIVWRRTNLEFSLIGIPRLPEAFLEAAENCQMVARELTRQALLMAKASAMDYISQRGWRIALEP